MVRTAHGASQLVAFIATATATAIAAALVAAGCIDPNGVDAIDADSDGLVAAGSIEEWAMLRFLNSEACSLGVLDDDMALESRAAANIRAHVVGGDATWGTADDDRFDSIYELDAVAYVGPVTLDRIVAWLEAEGRIPSMTIEGVYLTTNEAAAIVGFVNLASLAEIDVDAALDARAAQNLVAGRPFADVNAVAAVAYVGKVALEKLRDFAPLWTPPAPPAPPSGGTVAAGDACTEGACQSGLVCAGLTLWEEGLCIPESMTGSFGASPELAVPAAAGAAIASAVDVTGLASVPLDIVVQLDLAHTTPAALRVTLWSGNGESALLWDGPTAGGAALPVRFVAGWGIARDDAVNGTWSLEVVNVSGGGAGTLHAWTLELTSNWD